MFRKTIARVGVVIVLAAPGACLAQPANQTNTQSSLTAFVSYTDLRIRSVQQTLELLAATDEVRSGNWEAMKGLVGRYQRSDGGLAAWYARPDGRYYTGDQGLMGATLRDRDYFPDLMAGREIVGALVVSRSTGQRSAVVAVPVMQRGRMVGAIGASLFLDRLAEQVDSTLALPSDMTFFALAPNALTTLHRRTDRHFLDPREMGSETLRQAANEILSKHEGVVTYEFDQATKRAEYRRSGLTGWFFVITTTMAPVN